MTLPVYEPQEMQTMPIANTSTLRSHADTSAQPPNSTNPEHVYAIMCGTVALPRACSALRPAAATTCPSAYT